MDRSERSKTIPIDERSATRLADTGLRYGLVDVADETTFDAWLQAVSRGFHGERDDAAALARTREALAERRITGVWDDTAPVPIDPVATVASWIGEITLSPGRTIESWAVSEVSVSPTHRRRGIARNLLEGELRTAAAAGLAAAMLTVSESTIYGRFGFGPATLGATYQVETARATWRGPVAPGRIDHVTPQDAAALLATLHDRARLQVPGDTNAYPALWARMTGAVGDPAKTAPIRSVRYASADAEVTGVAVYRLRANEHDFTKHTVEIEALVTVDDEAYAALWRYFLELDLVESVSVEVRAPGEPLRWMIGDFRAVTERVIDHEWLRVLDVPAVLGGRDYAASGRIVLDVADSLGFAAGTWLLVADEAGTGVVTRLDAVPHATPVLELDVAELGSLVLGTVTAETLVRAGRITPRAAGDAAVADRLFRPARTPWLSTWY
ncbi:GNAT family N-acetyltransferase [Pseudoclavibacter chungangensis]|uniref:GNAT family N-acetyltransferase n=1 Tax=Pseudoclavibacter chungangensis TaxID=587635 RepID=A0A7J5BQR3_9MICO|nr:GNAT family N-acetyltransferase [Pseudoclavibacter chungangensis]KAB1656331.1 GNAT family N-acetyltransferase [Pseudoclavibacter chungangensis]NYJ67099.1 putative acetyltransferase [Pseudoclavibacter chungangensis]